MILTFRYRVKNPKHLADKARAVNFVWNYCGDVQNQARRRRMRWPTGFDLCKLVAGSTKELGLHSDTLQDITKHFARARDKAHRRPRWRKSAGSKRSLGWVPFQSARAIKVVGRTIRYLGVSYPVWLHRPIEGRILSGSFAEDARGRWFVNLQCEVEGATIPIGAEEIGVDLGLKDFAVLSNGEKVANPRHYRREEEALATAQRAGHTARVRALHAKIKNRRRHDLHVASINLVRRARAIYVGNVNAAGLTKTKLAKSVLDASWSTFRNMLAYKCQKAACVFREVDERFSTQDCSVCRRRGGPRGLEGLGVREWMCECGVAHDRDVNAAQNILLSGQNADLQLTESLYL